MRCVHCLLHSKFTFIFQVDSEVEIQLGICLNIFARFNLHQFAAIIELCRQIEFFLVTIKPRIKQVRALQLQPLAGLAVVEPQAKILFLIAQTARVEFE